MFTDMVGFTRGAQQDERATLGRLAEQESLVRPLIAARHGRVVKSTGDGLLVEFSSALQATECAVEIQERLRERNLRADGAPIELRIGIHLGDVESRGDDILGDAVNVAARVQPTADVGGVAVSQQVYDQVRNKLSLEFVPLPPQSLKGVRFPVTVFRVALPAPGRSAGIEPREPPADRLAVLPFANISPDAQDAYFSDGLTEEVIATLSELPGLRVIARTSVDHFRDGRRTVSEVGAELGVRWVLEGSVRKAGARLRFTAKLIDAQTQEQLWTGKYDRELVDVFELQTELARQIAEALPVRLRPGLPDRPERRPMPRPDSYLEYLQGRAALRRITRESLREARVHFERAVELDPSNASAYAGLSEAIDFLASLYREVSRAEARTLKRRYAQRALELDPGLAEVHTILAGDLADRYQYREAEEALLRAIRLNPSFPDAHLYYATVLADTRRPEEALREYAIAEQLDPLSSLPLAEHVMLLIYLSRLDEARTVLATLDRVEGHSILYRDRAGMIAFAEGDVATFRDGLDWFAANVPARPELDVAWAIAAAAEGDAVRAREHLARAETAPADARPTGQIARAYAFLGDLDACFRWIEQSVVEERFTARNWLYGPSLAAVRADPRFTAVLERLGIPPAPSG